MATVADPSNMDSSKGAGGGEVTIIADDPKLGDHQREDSNCNPERAGSQRDLFAFKVPDDALFVTQIQLKFTAKDQMWGGTGGNRVELHVHDPNCKSRLVWTMYVDRSLGEAVDQDAFTTSVPCNAPYARTLGHGLPALNLICPGDTILCKMVASAEGNAIEVWDVSGAFSYMCAADAPSLLGGMVKGASGGGLGEDLVAACAAARKISAPCPAAATAAAQVEQAMRTQDLKKFWQWFPLCSALGTPAMPQGHDTERWLEKATRVSHTWAEKLLGFVCSAGNEDGLWLSFQQFCAISGAEYTQPSGHGKARLDSVPRASLAAFHRFCAQLVLGLAVPGPADAEDGFAYQALPDGEAADARELAVAPLAASVRSFLQPRLPQLGLVDRISRLPLDLTASLLRRGRDLIVGGEESTLPPALGGRREHSADVQFLGVDFEKELLMTADQASAKIWEIDTGAVLLDISFSDILEEGARVEHVALEDPAEARLPSDLYVPPRAKQVVVISHAADKAYKVSCYALDDKGILKARKRGLPLASNERAWSQSWLAGLNIFVAYTHGVLLTTQWWSGLRADRRLPNGEAAQMRFVWRDGDGGMMHTMAGSFNVAKGNCVHVSKELGFIVAARRIHNEKGVNVYRLDPWLRDPSATRTACMPIAAANFVEQDMTNVCGVLPLGSPRFRVFVGDITLTESVCTLYYFDGEIPSREAEEAGGPCGRRDPADARVVRVGELPGKTLPGTGRLGPCVAQFGALPVLVTFTPWLQVHVFKMACSPGPVSPKLICEITAPLQMNPILSADRNTGPLKPGWDWEKSTRMPAAILSGPSLITACRGGAALWDLERIVLLACEEDTEDEFVGVVPKQTFLDASSLITTWLGPTLVCVSACQVTSQVFSWAKNWDFVLQQAPQDKAMTARQLIDLAHHLSGIFTVDIAWWLPHLQAAFSFTIVIAFNAVAWSGLRSRIANSINKERQSVGVEWSVGDAAGFADKFMHWKATMKKVDLLKKIELFLKAVSSFLFIPVFRSLLQCLAASSEFGAACRLVLVLSVQVLLTLFLPFVFVFTACKANFLVLNQLVGNKAGLPAALSELAMLRPENFFSLAWRPNASQFRPLLRDETAVFYDGVLALVKIALTMAGVLADSLGGVALYSVGLTCSGTLLVLSFAFPPFASNALRHAIHVLHATASWASLIGLVANVMPPSEESSRTLVVMLLGVPVLAILLVLVFAAGAFTPSSVRSDE